MPPLKFDDPTLRAVYTVLAEAKGGVVTSRDLKDAAGARWREGVSALTNSGLKIENFVGNSGNQSFRLIEAVPPKPLDPPRHINTPDGPVATQMHPGLDPLVRGPQLLTEPAPPPIPNPAPPILNPVTTTVVGAMLPDMAIAWQKQHGTYPTGIVLPFAFKSSLREFAQDIRRLGLRVFFGDVTETTFVLEGTALLTEAQRPHPDALH